MEQQRQGSISPIVILLQLHINFTKKMFNCYPVTTSYLWLERPPPPSYSAGLGNVSKPLSAGRLSTTVDFKTEGRCHRSTWRNCRPGTATRHSNYLLHRQEIPSVTPVLGWLVKVLLYVQRNRGLLGTGAQDVHLDFHTAPELCTPVL